MAIFIENGWKCAEGLFSYCEIIAWKSTRNTVRIIFFFINKSKIIEKIFSTKSYDAESFDEAFAKAPHCDMR